MLEQRSDQLQNVISRPARGAGVALLVCVPALLVSLALPLGPTKLVIGFIGAFGAGLALLTLAAHFISRSLGNGQQDDDSAAAEQDGSGLFAGHRAPDPVAEEPSADAEEPPADPATATATDPGAAPAGARSPEATQPIAVPVDLREGQGTPAAPEAPVDVRPKVIGRVRLTE